jgi:hypothetical protein
VNLAFDLIICGQGLLDVEGLSLNFNVVLFTCVLLFVMLLLCLLLLYIVVDVC